ncbi:flagellar hook-length control protein FliK [Pontibaca salina]|uniref:flagellar hook-length control protein FliK n=1 Tax=Pontibaca salina TaxID=2795731 RepID=UPI001E3C1507|nr:flagellar hook-length control protein FliK [Pontibaca salina]
MHGDEQAGTEDHITAESSEDSEEDSSLVCADKSPAGAWMNQSHGLQMADLKRIAQFGLSGDGIAPEADQRVALGNIADMLPAENPATSLIGVKNREGAENSLVGHVIPSVLRKAEIPEFAQSNPVFATLPLRGEAVAEPSTLNALTVAQPVRQTAEAIEMLMRQPDKRVEISLNPEELGRVRLALSRTEHGMTLAIMADRPETLDLMRRHIDQLAAELHRLGYSDFGFSFGGNSPEGRDRENPKRQHPHNSALPADRAQSAVIFNRPMTDGLDLRL